MIEKVMLVFGTRPEAIKMAPLVKEFQKNNRIRTIVCVTGQHREMLDQVLQLFEINPDYDLNIMKKGQDLYDVTCAVLIGMREILKEESPDLVLVHGDTTTSTTATLAAFYQQISVGHVEAGLRTYNLYSPWPEEANRQITGRLAKYHFAPTDLSKKNLINEGVDESNIIVTGNTVIDALFWVIKKIKNNYSLSNNIVNTISGYGIQIDKINSWNSNDVSIKRKLVLITGHRRENFGQGFINICEAIKELADQFPDVDFVYPMHLNPNVRKPISQVFGKKVALKNTSCNNAETQFSPLGGVRGGSNVYFIEPLDYLPFIYLMNASYLVLTDSGGIQEEAPGLGKPVLVMRDTTERPEALSAGTVRLVGTNKQVIVNELSTLLNDVTSYNLMSKANNPYGDGLASKRIVDYFKKLQL